ncbi:tetratricopeptide repeat protein [Hyphomicrobium sp.]|uniref:tetratricopeptide repeat protein n=1 Tax=Hyphomicrobium sp. TaxID=82 RepID=UPI001D2F3586|nr:tetratricopeptide repeat protein [Hyphomicrobium sp.]MBY0560070.1 tetratricopeptide repeat protein [Hyphomicrobium sp.]
MPTDANNENIHASVAPKRTAMAQPTRRTACILAAWLLLIAGSRTAVADIVTDCRSGNPARAIEGCSIVIDSGMTAPMDLATAYTYRANASETVGKHGDALTDLNKAIALNPNLAGLYSNRGNVYMSLGDEDQALADYTQAIQLDLNFAGAYFNRGNVYSRRGDLDSALTDLTAAVHLNPTYAPAYFNRGIVYFRMGRAADATVDFRKTLALNPQHEGALSALRLLEKTAHTK